MQAIMLPEFQMGMGNKWEKECAAHTGLISLQLSFFFLNQLENKNMLPIDLIRRSD